MGVRLIHFGLVVLWFGAIWLGLDWAQQPRTLPLEPPTRHVDWPGFFVAHILPRLPVAEQFDPPLRPPDGLGAVIVVPFSEAGHLGEDWATAPGAAAAGEPVRSVADGWVNLAQDFGNYWGNVVFVCSRLGPGRYPPLVEITYTQMDRLDVRPGDFVRRGQPLGTVGSGHQTFSPHLHWEVRQTVGLGIGPGFDVRRDGWLEPSDFLSAHRGARAKTLQLRRLTPAERPGWGSDL